MSKTQQILASIGAAALLATSACGNASDNQSTAPSAQAKSAQPAPTSVEVDGGEILNCKLGIISMNSGSTQGGIALIDIANGNATRTETARTLCKNAGATPGF